MTAATVSSRGAVGVLGEVSVDWLIQSVSQISVTGTVPVTPATAQRLLKADRAVPAESRPHFKMVKHESLLPFLFCLGLLLFVKSFTQPSYLIWSATTFGLSLNTYQAARVFVPFFLIAIVFLFRGHFCRHKRANK
ncbi:MAG: hypothetical protein QNJ65_06470 [Xenococcaceae cyanobacterium MO_234.B1]|nr:hypothetical protein [Xenococcaceae cyanobacterium MO_234.B1]